MSLPFDLFKGQTNLEQEEWSDESHPHHFSNPQTRKLSFSPKKSLHGLFSQEEIETDETENEKDASKKFVTCATLELPLELKNGDLVVSKRIRTQVNVDIPPRAGNGVWSSSFGGSTLVRGPLGCATGQVAVAYHLNDASRILGGIHVGDVAKVYTGVQGNHHFKTPIQQQPYRPRSSHWSLVLYTLPNEPTVGTSLATEHTWNSLVETKLSLDCPTDLQPKARASISTCAVHQTELEIGWNSSKYPQVNLSLCPKLYGNFYGNLTCGWDKGATTHNGSWHMGASLKQSFMAKHVASPPLPHFHTTNSPKQRECGTLGLGFKITQKGDLSWILSWSQESIHIQVPITVSTAPLTFMHSVQALFLSWISAFLQKAIQEVWNSSLQILVDKSVQERNLQEQVLLQKSKARRDAQQQKELMERQAATRQKAEQEDNGLVIVQAYYQVEGGDVWDVATQLQFWTMDSTLELPSSSKKHLLGFYDVSAVGQDKNSGDAVDLASPFSSSWWSLFWRTKNDTTKTTKQGPIPTLYVKYQFSGDVYHITIQDNESLVLPSPKAVSVG